MRLVLDTNAAVSGLIWHGNPGKLIDAARAGSVILYASAPLLGELHRVLGREKFAKHLQVRGLSATQIFEGYAALARVVVPAIIQPVIIEDPDDDAVLACAVAAKADLVVSPVERSPSGVLYRLFQGRQGDGGHHRRRRHVAKLPYVDAKRMGIAGASYGGYA